MSQANCYSLQLQYQSSELVHLGLKQHKLSDHHRCERSMLERFPSPLNLKKLI